MARPQPAPPDRPLVYAAALALLLFASLTTFLSANDYPLLSAEVGLLFAACLAAGAALGLAVRFGMRVAAALLLGACAAACIELMQDLEGRKAALVLLLLGCLAAAWFLRRHIAAVITAASLVWLSTTLVIPATTPEGQAAAERDAQTVAPNPPAGGSPVILHLVLDEHIGVDGVPPEIAGSETFRRLLIDFYVERGFRIDTGAYSQYVDTRNSLANLMNFTSSADPWAHLAPGRSRPYVLQQSAYFGHLRERGYRLRVYESDYLDFCRVPGMTYAACIQYSGHKIGAVHRTSLDAAERAQFIVHSALASSYYVARARTAYEKVRRSFAGAPLPAWEHGPSRVGPIPVLPVLAQLESDLRRAKRGTVYFAHLLIPHYPYVLDESCGLREETGEWLDHALHVGERVLNTAESRAERYVRYFAQVRCQLSLLDRLFDAMKEAGVWDDAIVIVHGDHGSRILRLMPVAANAARLTRADLRDAYSTLFAIRAPGTAAGARGGQQPLQRLLGEAFGIAGAEFPARLYLRAENGATLPPHDFTRLK
ncbi:MAG TPA: hypothetical protein VFX67_11055 [Burkholderiales bacterium]|nr:hypothetical protein [Burkholderiales bacterium]